MEIDQILIEFGDLRGGILYIGVGAGRSVPLLDGLTGEPVWIDQDQAQQDKISGQGPVRKICLSIRGVGLRSLN